MEIYKDIQIKKEDLEKVLYFTLMKFNFDKSRIQGTSSKTDNIGAFIDRWVNRISEFIVLNSLKNNDQYNFVPDYFLYDSKSEKDASDVLGIQLKNGKIVPFIRFKNGSWERQEGMPKIEIKTVRSTQNLLTVRDTQLDDDYYVFVESNFNDNYLLNFFEESLFEDRVFESIKINKTFFVTEDRDNFLKDPYKIQTDEQIGKLKLIGIYKKDEFLKHTRLLKPKQSSFYFINVIKSKQPTKNLKINNPINVEIDKNTFNFEHENQVILPFRIKGFDIKIIGKSKTSLYLTSSNDFEIEDTIFIQDSVAKVELKEFERSSNWSEYTVTKNYLRSLAKDSTLKLFEQIDEIYQRNN